MDIKYLMVGLSLFCIGFAFYKLIDKVSDALGDRTIGKVTNLFISLFVVSFVITCLIGGLGALGMAFPTEAHGERKHATDSPTSM